MTRLAPFIALTLAAVGCAAPGMDDGTECLGKCDVADSKDTFLTLTDGFEDPVTHYLSSVIEDNGSLDVQYRDVLDGVGDILGCDRESERHYAVLTNEAYAPRTPMIRCADDPTKASQFFMVLTATTGSADLENWVFHLVGWDKAQRRYNHFLVNKHPQGGLKVDVRPDGCLSCHGEAPRPDRWHPKMNELTLPWSGWNASPGFESHLFDENLPTYAADAPVFAEITDGEFLDSASNFQRVVEAGISRVTSAHLRERRQGIDDLELAFTFLRPLFCDDGANYVSEVHRSGQLAIDAIVDRNIGDMYKRIQAYDWPWSWLNDSAARLPYTEGETVVRMPVRSELSIQLERSLVANRVLTVDDVLQLRAIDWTRPVASETRCRLYEQGESRILSGDIEFGFDQLSEEPTMQEILPLLFNELLKVKVDGSLVPLRSEGGYIAIADAEGSDAAAALKSGELDGYHMDLGELGSAIEAHVDAISSEEDRASLLSRRRALVCKMREAELASLPLYDDITCD